MTAIYGDDMRTVVLGPRPPELEAFIERRRRRGQDLYDEVWEGEYHVAPAAHFWHGYVVDQVGIALEPWVRRLGLVRSSAFNLGEPGDFRVPDLGVHREIHDGVWVPTAVLVVEVLSPDDESWDKLPFYASRGVEEALMVDPVAATIQCLRVDRDGQWQRVHRSAVLDATISELAAAVSWPGREPGGAGGTRSAT